MVRRRAADAGILTRIRCHTFRATGITNYLRNGRIDVAQRMAGHAKTNLIERDVHFSVGAGSGHVDGGNHLRDMPLNGAPSALAQNDHGDFAAGKVLLVGQIAVSGDQDIKSRSFGGGEKFTVC
jgi:hypothetical protein